MNRLHPDQRAQVVRCLVDGNSVRATVRITDVSIPTVLKVLVTLGTACQKYHDEHVGGLTCSRVQMDEIWSFVHAKQKNVPENLRGRFGVGDVWTWTAMDAQTKLIIAWHVGRRDLGTARIFVADVARRILNRIQLTTDGHRAYLDAVDEAWATEVDYATLIKVYGAEPQDTAETRYSPAKCIGTRSEVVNGNPDPKHVSTSYVERQNLTMRMNMRRFTRLTNAFSKKIENHKHSVALHFMYYNYVRQHQTLRVSPAMEAGLTNHLWSVEELCALVDQL